MSEQMDIWGILTQESGELLLSDLEFFDQELLVGDYDAVYVNECRQQIKLLRKWLKTPENERSTTPPNGNKETAAAAEAAEPAPENAKNAENAEHTEKPKARKKGSVIVGLADLTPDEAAAGQPSLSPEEIFRQEVIMIRKQQGYRTDFKNYISQSKTFTPQFLDECFGFFQPWELDTILSICQLGDAFLEKYFGALDHGRIAHFQSISEEFFMRHWRDLPLDELQKNKKIPWRDPAKRSKQLDVFLRLKGVRL